MRKICYNNEQGESLSLSAWFKSRASESTPLQLYLSLQCVPLYLGLVNLDLGMIQLESFRIPLQLELAMCPFVSWFNDLNLHKPISQIWKGYYKGSREYWKCRIHMLLLLRWAGCLWESIQSMDMQVISSRRANHSNCDIRAAACKHGDRTRTSSWKSATTQGTSFSITEEL